ncbi:MAG: Na+/H+ antiporter NhaC family protein [Clostridiales bacterium]|nr:Na+/H+ antiporter NhaC family protein [Clostridiales bacterium]
MKRPSSRILAISLLVMVVGALLATTVFAADGEEYVSNMYGTFWALVPPIIAIVLALITKEVYSSLFIGIVAGALFYSNFKPVMTLDTVVNDGLIAGVSNGWNAGIFLFLVLLGILVALINKAGGSAAFGRWAETHIKTRAGAMLATFALGVLIFVDDYFNCLTVGSVMRPVTDSHKISRAKLAYLIDATAAPVCMIAPISSWAAAVSGMVEGEDGLELFVKAIPYNLYSLMTFVFIIAITLMKFDYGPMKLHEMNARLNGDLFTSGENLSEDEEEGYSPKGRVLDLVIPIVLLVGFCITGMIYVGGFFEGTGFIEAFGGTDASVGLPWGAIIALVITVIYFLCRRVMTFKEAMACVPKGFVAMVPALLILTFAITLKNMTNLLGAGTFVEDAMYNAAPGFANFLPAIFFVVAVFIAFSTGTSWGTFGILIPIVVKVLSNDPQLMIIGISACLAGAVCGDHVSPISDTTIMSSAGAQCDHVNHVSTQMPYAMTVAAVSFVGYIIAAFTRNVWIILGSSIAILLLTLFVIRAKESRKDKMAAE